jgi:hypothetical protein
LGERSGAPSGLSSSSFVMCNTPVEVQFTSAECLNYPCRTPIAACQRPLSIFGSLPTRSARRRVRLNCCRVRSPSPPRRQRPNISDGQPHGPLRSGGRGYIPSLRCCLARAALGLAINGTTRSNDCHRALPNVGARRPCRTVRPLWRTTDRVQQLPFPQLPQVPVARPSGMDRGSAGRATRYAVFPCRLHRSRRDRRDCLP